MIDAGSSRSNVYLYEWPGAKENETGIVTETLNCKVDGESHITKRGGGGGCWQTLFRLLQIKETP